MKLLRQFFPALLLLGAAVAGLCAETPASPRGTSVRVVSQTVGTDELLLALAAPEQVAALSHLARDPAFSAVPEEARRYPQLQVNGDAESILRYAPTLVLFANYSRAELVVQIRRAGVRVLIFDRYDTLDDTYANLRLLARELGAEARAERLIADCQARMTALAARLRGVKPVRVIAPSPYGMIPGRDSTFQDLCDHAAAENLAATVGHLEGHAVPPSEQMLTWPVDYVVVAGTDLGSALAPFRTIPPYEYMPAVREGRAVLLKPHLLSCVSHHRIDGYEMLARALHPEAFQ
jgi:iron complex transport system substrate-binding protein